MPNHNFIDETGKQYGELTVLYRAENTSGGRAMWHCRCSCGNELDVLGKNLRNGNTKSCGCYQRRRAAESNMKRAGSLVGQRFGKLQVLEEIGFLTKTSGRNSRVYKCLCDCGNTSEVCITCLKNGNTTSCGCRKKSIGENNIGIFLLNLNIPFETQKTFPNLKNYLNNRLLKFDFYLPNENILIEFDGP